MKLIYICTCDVSVYDSQVISLLEYYLDKGIDVTLIQGFRNLKEKTNLERKLETHRPIDVVWMKWSPISPFHEKTKINNLYKAICCVPDVEKALFHLRDIYCSYILLKLLRKYDFTIPTLLDVRGVSIEEMKYTFWKSDLLHKFQFLYLFGYYKYVYNYVFGRKQHHLTITSVSPLINDYIKNKYKKCGCEMFFHPNIAGSQFAYSDSKRNEIRAELGIKPDEVVAICSTNGNAVWQKDYMVVGTLISEGIKVINLSSVPINIDGCYTTKVGFSEMPAYLSAADIAVLWRDNTFINNSASPSKFSEFAAMGLYIIHNNSVRVAKDYIEQNQGGCLVNEVEELHSKIDIKDVKKNREYRIKQGLACFGINHLGDSYISLYNNLLK